jgi:hypothetical protein
LDHRSDEIINANANTKNLPDELDTAPGEWRVVLELAEPQPKGLSHLEYVAIKSRRTFGRASRNSLTGALLCAAKLSAVTGILSAVRFIDHEFGEEGEESREGMLLRGHVQHLVGSRLEV